MELEPIIAESEATLVDVVGLTVQLAVFCKVGVALQVVDTPPDLIMTAAIDVVEVIGSILVAASVMEGIIDMAVDKCTEVVTALLSIKKIAVVGFDCAVTMVDVVGFAVQLAVLCKVGVAVQVFDTPLDVIMASAVDVVDCIGLVPVGGSQTG